MLPTEAVTTRPSARRVAVIAPAESISDIIQPPKISPLGLVSAGIASVRAASSPRGSADVRGLPSRPLLGRISQLPCGRRTRYGSAIAATQYRNCKLLYLVIGV